MKLFTPRTGHLLIIAVTVLAPMHSGAVEFTLSGQVNRLIMHIDNGVDKGVVHADNDVSGTRFRFKGEGNLGNGLTAGLYFEKQIQVNQSSSFNINNIDSENIGTSAEVRHSNVWLKGRFGKITLGQGNGAANASAQADKSGTGVIQYSGSSHDLLGGFEYGTSGISIVEARDDFDALSRNNNIRYDAQGGFYAFALSLGNGSSTEFSARYKTGNVEVRLGLWDESDQRAPALGHKGQAISASWSAGLQGLNVTGSFSGDDRNPGNPTNRYLKAGYKMGRNAYAVDYSVTRDLAAQGVDADALSLAWVRYMMKGVQLYAMYRVESLDGSINPNVDDITALIGGVRVKF